VYLNEFADSLAPRDMRGSAEFASLLQSATDLGIPHDPGVAYVSRQTVLRGMRFHFSEWGDPDAPPVVLLHGGNQSSHSWDLVSLHLADDFHVYALDQRGHGDSEPATVYNPIVAYDDLSGVLDQLGVTSLVMVGLSMGGRNAMYFAAKRPEAVKKLVIVDIGPEISKRAGQPSAGPPEPDTWESIEQAAQHLYRSNPYPGIHYYRWVVSESLRPGPDGGLVWAWHPSIKLLRSQADIDWWGLLKTIVPPTLVLRGAESTVLDRDVAERMGRDLPHGKFVEIPRAVHTLHEDNPEAVLAALNDFLGF
jgi:pimeloyl-ACP methyl ester carboxylesterase